MTVNVPLLRKTLEHITAHPDEWDQRVWARETECGTACCLAGWAVVFGGLTIDWQIAASEVTDGRRIEDAANELLGIPDHDGAEDDLYADGNTLRDLYRISNDLTDGEIPIPDVLPDGS